MLIVLLLLVEPKKRSRYSDWLWAGRQRSRNSSPCSVKNYLFLRRPDRLWGLPRLLSKRYQERTFSRVKRSGRDSKHSLVASAEIKTAWLYIYIYIHSTLRLYVEVLN
jgi:hypothetical protein